MNAKVRDKGKKTMLLQNYIPKKRSTKLWLGKKIDSTVQEYVLKLREYGCPVDAYLVVAVAEGITKAME